MTARRGMGGVLCGALGVALLALFAIPAHAGTLSPGDQKCLACHQIEGLQKPLQNGESLSLHIDGATFAKSVHSLFGCAGCHSDINLATHPGAPAAIASHRSFSIMRAQVCANCHADEASQWKDSVHAALVKAGNPLAPVCTSCHAPHAVMQGEASAIDTVPCKTCHGDIYAAYSGSMHGMLRRGGDMQAPLCFNCHGAHDVKVPTAGAGLKATCFGCHKDAEAKHADWLPNTQLHFQVVSCPACHSPTAHRRVDLVLYNAATKEDAAEPIGVPEFAAATGTDGGMNASGLFQVLQALNKPGVKDKTSIRGRLDVTTGEEAHRLTFANEAIHDCRTCHQAGAAAFQSVSISVAGPGGVPVYYDVNSAVLHSVISVNDISGFYAIGGTRITLLDILLVLALLGGFGIPVLHTIFWRLTHRGPNHPPKG
jgi:NAD-dependent SIR2 family protein deacetylase